MFPLKETNVDKLKIKKSVDNTMWKHERNPGTAFKISRLFIESHYPLLLRRQGKKGEKLAKGWIALHRSLLDCDIWSNDEPYDMRSAWVDLLLLANHRDNKMLFDYEMITIRRGQYLTSVRKLGERWSWSKNRVLKYLKLLESLNMIKRDSNNQRTLLTIVNYALYQDQRDTDMDTGVDTPMDTGMYTGMPQTTMINNDNNENNDSSSVEPNDVQEIIDTWNANYRPISIVSPTRCEALQNLLEVFTVEDVKKAIAKTKASSYIQSSHFLTFDWLIKIDNIVKVLDGNFDDNDSRQSQEQILREKWGIDNDDE